MKTAKVYSICFVVGMGEAEYEALVCLAHQAGKNISLG